MTSRKGTIGAEVWAALEDLFARTPAIQSLCLEATRSDISLAICNNHLSNLFAKLAQFRALRLYAHPASTSYWYLSPPAKFEDYAALLKSLDRFPELECLALRGCVQDFRCALSSFMSSIFIEIL